MVDRLASVWDRMLRRWRPEVGGVAEFAVATNGAVAPTAETVLGTPTGYNGLISEVVDVPPDREIVGTTVSFTGIGAQNLQVLGNETAGLREPMTTAVIEAMLDDDAVKSCVDILKLQALSGPLHIHPSVEPHPEGSEDIGAEDEDSSGADPDEARHAAEFCRRAHERLETPLNVWGRDALDALVYGNKAAEKVLEMMVDGPDAGLYQLKSLKMKPRWSYHLCTDPYLNLIALYCDTIVGPAYVNKRHFVVFSWDVRDADPRGSSILRAARDPWRRRRRALESRSKGDDQFGTPSTAQELPPNAPVESIDPETGRPAPTTTVANKAMKAFMNGSTLTHGNGGKVYVVESSRDGTQINASIDDNVRCINTAILLSPKATMDAKHYTQGGSEIGKDFITLLSDFIRHWYLTILRKQVFHYLLAENFGPLYADLYTPKLTIGAMPIDDFAALASPLAVMGQAGLLTPSELEWLLARVGIPRPLPGELRIGPSGPIPNELPDPNALLAQAMGTAPGEEPPPEEPAPEPAPATETGS